MLKFLSDNVTRLLEMEGESAGEGFHERDCSLDIKDPMLQNHWDVAGSSMESGADCVVRASF